jgi:hypothetical protein
LHVPKENHRKLGSKTCKCLFLGYDTKSKTYRLYDPTNRKIVLSRDVIFDETKIGFHYVLENLSSPKNFLPTLVSTSSSHASHDDSEPTLNQPDLVQRTNPTGGIPSEPTSADFPLANAPDLSLNPPQCPGRNQPIHASSPPPRRYPIRTRAPPTKLQDYWTMISELLEEPLTFQQAYSHVGWREAIDREADSLKRNQTWTTINRPDGVTQIQAKWIFRTKKGPDGTIVKFKIRLVAKRFQQTQEIDYLEIFAPIVRWSTIRFILSLAARRQWKLRHMDVVTAFLSGLIKEDIYLEIPEGFEEYGNPTKVLKLNRALYGLKQAPRVWYERIDTWLRNQGLIRSKNDPNLYFYTNSQGQYTIVLLYVDDLLVTGDNDSMIKTIQQALLENFEMTDLGEAKQYLGVEFEYHSSGIYIHQRAYILNLLKRFNMETCKPSPLSMDPGCQLSKTMETKPVDLQFYRSLVGSLIYVTNTRLDVCYAISSVSRFMDAPEEAHLQAAKQILRYLKGTIDFALHMKSWGEEGVYSFADADWGRDLDTRRSTSGLLHKFGESTIHWSSKLQPCVSLSTTEAEYRVLIGASKDILYLRHLLEEIGFTPYGATPLYSDNQSCIRLAGNPVLHERTKHIEIQQHFIREKVQSEEIDVDFIPTAKQANFLTKPLPYTQFVTNRNCTSIELLPGYPNRLSNP